MNLLHDDVKLGLAQLLLDGLSEMGVQENLETIYGQLGTVPSNQVGHVAFPMFTYAKALRSAPPKLAVELVNKLAKSDLVAEVNPTGPYLNFVLSLAQLGNFVAKPILSGEFFKKKLTQDTPRTMVEYSQPNTHKEMHVGHMRNLALGNALIRMHRYIGYDIVSCTFPGDVGTHVAKCLWYLKYHNKKSAPETERGAWLGEMYVAGTLLLAELEGTDEGATAKVQMTAILKELEAKEGEFFDLWKETRQWSIEQMEAVYDWADVKFDEWYWESDVDSASVAYVKEQHAKGMFQESEGAIGMDLSEDDLGFCLLLKSDGTGLYATKDVELARRKFQVNGIERSVYIVDKRQEWHFKQVFKVLEKMGFEQAKDCFHLQYDYVEGKEGMFSSRLGNAVPVVDLINKMTVAIRNDYLEKSVTNGIMTAEEAEVIAPIVAQGAIKYGMVKIDPAKKIVFNMEEWIRISGDSGPYQQYTFARINSLCKKQDFDVNGPFDWSKLADDREIELLLKAGRFNEVALAASQSYKPSLLTNYLYDLAQLYNSLNNSVIIRDITDPLEKNSRMAVHMVVAKVIENGLSIMGIPVPAKM